MTDNQPSDAEAAIAAHIAACQATIAEHGYMIAGIGADAEIGSAQCAYTIGLSIQCGFEFAMCGLPMYDMHNALAKLVDRARQRKLSPVDRLFVEGVLENGYVLRLRPADTGWDFPWIARALELETRPPVWQAQFPSAAHLFPGETGFDPSPYTQLDYSLPPRDEADNARKDASC